MKFIFLVLCAFTIYQAGAIELAVSRAKCRKGAEFVCRSKEIAKACGAIEYCNQNEWNEQSIFDSDKPAPFGCQICLGVMKPVYDQLQNPEFQSILKTYSEEVCKIVGLKRVQKTCLEFVDQQLIPILTSNLNPDKVCKEIWACEKTANGLYFNDFVNNLSEYANEVPSGPTDRNVGNMDCVICKKMTKKASEFMKQTNEAEFKQLLERVCEAPNVNKPDCLRWMDENSNWIYENLGPIVSTSSVCSTFEVCPNESENLEMAKVFLAPFLPTILQAISSESSFERITSTEQESFVCSICKEAVDEIRLLLKSVNQTTFKHELEYVCKYSRPYKSKCLSLVDEFSDMIYEDIVDTFKDYKICGALGKCATNVDDSKSSESDFNDVESMYSGENMQDLQNDDPNPNCLICQELIKSIEDQIDTNSSKEEIKEALERICSLVPSKKISNECKQYVDKNVDSLIDNIVQLANPKLVCIELGACDMPNSNTIQPKRPSYFKGNAAKHQLSESMEALFSSMGYRF